ncbi:ectoine hydroxylase [Gordonia paraffinivorans]|uniref:phytanoyl-CoA dioxygenase family protein n=1 Tax=Gordonia paraffinivorans TaxID=175628 RepID=UPI001C92C64E|nr:phytanoyl-CoA dioxygenase family protein [Gordonia paraffinivorans]MBY4572558.1 ectoine hydroxylase [Gordonia paraffinivorans]
MVTQTASQNTEIIDTRSDVRETGVAAGVDVYRTRLPHRGQIEPRPHNTVWGSMKNPGPLSPPELRRYAERGYHTEPKVLSPEDIETCLGEVTAITERLGDDDRVIREPSSGDVRSLFAVHRISEAIAEIVNRESIRGVAEQILDDEVTIHQSRVNLKPGFAGGPFYWHSDFETWHAEDGMPAPRALSVSLALTPNLSTNGPLMIIPGSHRRFVSCVGETPDDYHRESLTSYRPPFGTPEEEDVRALADELGIDTITGPAGSALYFDSNCLHASGGNITPYPRSNLFVVFNAKSNALQAPFGGTPPRPDHLAHR